MPRPLDQVKQLFDSLAHRYETDIVVPAFRAFAQGVIETAQPKGHEIALDVGTGTGVLARLLAPQVRHVTGIDLAPQMIAHAKQLAAQESLHNTAFEEADAHRLAYPDQHFDLAVSSFGLNHTQPRRVLAELYRLLKPNGVLAFHEWSVQHRLDAVLIEVLAEYMLGEDEASDEVIAWRQFVRQPRQWDNMLQEVGDFEETLAQAGFGEVKAWEDAPVTVVVSVADFLTYKLAWTTRQAELAAMDEWRRADCLDALRAALQAETAPDGSLHYNPTLFRVRAVK